MEKISEIKGRILQFIEFKSISKADFCKKTGISYGNMKGNSLKSEIGGEQISSILTSFSEISPDWLLTGTGKMLRSTNPDPPQTNPMHVDTEAVKLLLEEKDRSIHSLTTQVEDLRAQLKVKDEQLASKDEQIGKLMGMLDRT